MGAAVGSHVGVHAGTGIGVCGDSAVCRMKGKILARCTCTSDVM